MNSSTRMKGSSLWRFGLRWQPRSRFQALQSLHFARRSRQLTPSQRFCMSSSAFQYELIEFVENIENYHPGGYHPVNIGDRLHNRYRVVHKLGHGTFSTVWLAHDQKTQKFVAVKVGIADVSSTEIETLNHLTQVIKASSGRATGASLIPLVKDNFTISGPNGNHQCLVTRPTRCSLSESKEEGGRGLFQLEVARSLAAQLILAVRFVHSQGYCHGDLHLGNLLLKLTSPINDLTIDELYTKIANPMPQPVVRVDGRAYSVKPGVPSHVNLPLWLGKEDGHITLSEAKLLLSDFGTAFRPSDKKTFKSQTPLVIRPPEVLLEPETPLSFGSDIWSLGCVIFELFAHTSLFDGFMTPQEGIMAQQVLLLGPMPDDWLHQWLSSWGPLADKTSLNDPEGHQSWDKRFEDAVQDARRSYGYPVVSDREKGELLELLRRLLAWKPADRPSAEQVSEMDWVRNWGLPAFSDGCKGADEQ